MENSNKLTTSQIRDALIKKQTLYDQSLQTNEAELKKVKNHLSRITEDKILILEQAGYNVRDILNIDLEKLKIDQEYHTVCMHTIENIIKPLHKYLEEKANA